MVMAALFSKPKIPAATPTPPAPTIDDAQTMVEDSRDRRGRRGRSSTTMVEQETAVGTAARALTGY